MHIILKCPNIWCVLYDCSFGFLRYLCEGNNRVYSGPPSQLSYTVSGLQFYTQYTFSVEACTDRGCEVSTSSQAWTLSAIPEAQPAPSLIALANDLGAHDGVRISWDPPAKPNGNITSYEVYRKEMTASAGNVVFIFLD